MIGLLLLLVAPFAGDNRAWPATLEVEGPVESVRVDCGPRGDVELRLDLLPGERRLERVPLPLVLPFGLDEAALPAAPLDVEGSGQARWLGWDAEALRFHGLLPPGLTRRARPPGLEERSGGGRVAGLAGLALVLVGLLARRPAGRAFVLLGVPVLVWWVAGRAPAHEARVLWEVDLDSESAVAVATWRGRATWSGAAWLEVEPAGAPVRLVVDARVEPPVVEARVTHGVLVLRQPVALRSGADLATRLGGTLADCWTRAGAGSWEARGTWVPGARLPGVEAGPDPPGWLVAGLPQGVGLLVGRAGDGRWIRASGFEP